MIPFSLRAFSLSTRTPRGAYVTCRLASEIEMTASHQLSNGSSQALGRTAGAGPLVQKGNDFAAVLNGLAKGAKMRLKAMDDELRDHDAPKARLCRLDTPH